MVKSQDEVAALEARIQELEHESAARLRIIEAMYSLLYDNVEHVKVHENEVREILTKLKLASFGVPPDDITK